MRDHEVVNARRHRRFLACGGSSIVRRHRIDLIQTLLFGEKPSDGFHGDEPHKQAVVRSLEKRHALMLCFVPPLLPCSQCLDDGHDARPGYLPGRKPVTLGFDLQEALI